MAQITDTISQINTQEMVNGKIIITPEAAYVYSTDSGQMDPIKKDGLFQSLRTLQQALASGAITLPDEGITLFFNLRMG
jgi:hypothetical protein